MSMATVSTHSRGPANTLFHYSPLPTTWSTLFHYSPLSPSTSVSFSPHHTTTLVHPRLSSTSSRSPVSTSLSQSSAAPSILWPDQTPNPDHPAISDCEIPDPSLGLTIAVLMFLGILVILTVIIWCAEVRACKSGQKTDRQTHTTSSRTRVSEPIGLGITIQPAIDGKRKNVYFERSRYRLVKAIKKAWAADVMGRLTDFAVAILRAGPGTDPEEGLLLSVQEKDRAGEEKNRVEIRADLSREC